MKITCFLCALVPCFASISCVTHDLTDQSLTGAYAWLDTPPRAHMRDTRPQSTLTQWKTALPPARATASTVSKASKKRVSIAKREDSDLSRQNYNSASHAQGYRATYAGHSRRHHQPHHGFHHKGYAAPQRQRFVRTVTKVGPSIVPQLSTPSSTRSYSGGPRILPVRGAATVPVPTPQVRRDVGSRVRRGESRSDRVRR